MTPAEWVELVDWINARFPNGWSDEQAVAFFDDLRSFDASHVWGAVYDVYNRGTVFAPTGSQLVAGALEVRRSAAVAAVYDRPALPEPVRTVGGWLERLYPGESVSGAEHVRRVHAARGPCGSRFCDIHETARQPTTQSVR